MLPRAQLTPSPKTVDRLLADLASYALVLAPHNPVLTLGTRRFNADEYRRLALTFGTAIESGHGDARTPDMCQVLLGVGNLGPTVPCLFWSSELAYVQAAAHLSSSHAELCALCLRTLRLRRLLFGEGAFVGWIPLSDDQRPDARHAAYVAHFRAHGVQDRQCFWYPRWSAMVLAYTPPRTPPETGKSSLASLTAREEPESPCAGRTIHAPRPVYAAGVVPALRMAFGGAANDLPTTAAGPSTNTNTNITTTAAAIDIGIPTFRPSTSTAGFVGFSASSGVTDGGFRISIGDVGARTTRRLPKRHKPC